MQKPRIKICCILNIDEAWLAIRHGASALGLVSEMPSGPGVISDDEIAAIARSVPPGVATFLLTSKQDVDAIVEQHRRCRTNTIQLVDKLQNGSYDDLRAALPGIAIVQVIHVVDDKALAEARQVAPHVDAILLDSGNPNLAVKELGGTGRIHNWQISRAIREQAGRPIFLAGGLNPDNVAKAVQQVQPFGLDVCSGVRVDGKLNEDRLRDFFAAASGFSGEL